MKKITFLIIFVFAALIIFNACEDYVTDIDPLINVVEDDRLDDQDQLGFLIKGVQTQYSTVRDMLSILIGDLSDELFFDENQQGASFPSYREINLGEIQLDNTSVEQVYDDLGELRHFADNLVQRVNAMDIDADQKKEALFIGYFFGGLARAFYATYFGLYENQPGGIINNGPFIDADDMYDLAIVKLKEALNYTVDLTLAGGPAYSAESLTKLTNSMIARTYLYKEDWANAKTYADAGLVNGDADFESLHTTDSPNGWWGFAGAGRCQLAVDFRFFEYINADPLEANRILITETPAVDPDNIPGGYTTYYRQSMYETEDTPITIMSWQENNLMLAELALQGQGGDALALVNEVRASHDLADLAVVDLDVVYVERDKELFTSGSRLADQHRFDKWHLGADKWHYLPITQDEWNNNPNLK
ncbi:MAG: hypothetical protein K8R79_10490 [Calditrichales bacterium]|nr:hypothetical protein [Calditrichales bacterium]